MTDEPHPRLWRANDGAIVRRPRAWLLLGESTRGTWGRSPPRRAFTSTPT
jgi:hypothetical protein